jgi:tetratricopeptide (TPR) repeat protein
MRSARPALAALTLLALVAPAGRPEEPKEHVPLRPVTRQELDRLEALKLFGLAALHEQESRLVEAVRTYETARRLDPDAAAIPRALAPLYLALDRIDDALEACRRAVELAPDDHATAYVWGRQLRQLDRPREAVAVLARLAARPTLKEAPELFAQAHSDLGALCEQVGDLAGAEAALRALAGLLEEPATLLETGAFTREEIATRAAETYERLGRVCLKAGQTERAVAAFEKAAAKEPAWAGRLAYHLAEVFAKQGKHAEALARLDEYLRGQPQGMEGYELQIVLLGKLNRPAEVVPSLKAAAARDNQNVALKLLLARELRKAGLPGEAENVYLALKAAGAGPEVFRGLFEIYRDDPAGGKKALDLLDATMEAAAGKEGQPGSPAEAANARAMVQVLREEPKFVDKLLPAVQERVQPPPEQRPREKKGLHYRTQALFADLAARAHRLAEAEALYRNALTREDGPGDLEADIYAGLLQVLAEGQKHEAIVAVCRDGLKKAEITNRVLFHVELAEAQLALNRPKEALEAIDDAVREAPAKQQVYARRQRATLLSQLGRHREAIAECQALLKEYNQPGDVRGARLTLSLVYSAAKEPDKAEEQLELLLQADPNDAGACNDLGYLWADRNKRLDEAEKLIRKALDLDRKQRSADDGIDDNAAYVDSLGWALFRQGRLEEARRELERASALPSGAVDPVVWDHLGDACFRLGQKERAGACWRKAVSLYESGRRRPDDHYRDAREKLKLLAP